MTAIEWIECKRRLVNFGYTPKEANEWMMTPHPQLDGRPAAKATVQEVSAIIERLETGAYL